MRNQKVTIVFGLAVLIALFIAGGCARTPEQRAGYFVKRMASELNLNEAQKAQLDKIKDEFLAKRPDMRKHREESVKELNELMRSAEIDKARLNAVMEKNKTMANDVIGFISAKFVEIHDMLTPEQREKLVAHIEKHMGRGHQ